MTIGTLLKEFCHPDPVNHPGLALPFYVPTASRTTATAATDGETAAIWTKKRLGRYLDFQSGPGSDHFFIADWRKRWRAGAAFPLPKVPRKPSGLARVIVAGWPAYLPWEMVARLERWDACTLGSAVDGGEARVEEAGCRAWVSVRLAFGPDLFSGVLRCEFPKEAAK